jgi:1,4-alpha-glucan branching enzyme
VSGAPPSAEREVVRFELSAPRASHVALVGSFNEWNPVATPLARDASGKWVVAVQLPRGRHVYAFVVDGDVTADPSAPRAADDDFGSPSSVVLVSSPRT